jgi:hypothetical protein
VISVDCLWVTEPTRRRLFMIRKRLVGLGEGDLAEQNDCERYILRHHIAAPAQTLPAKRHTQIFQDVAQPLRSCFLGISRKTRKWAERAVPNKLVMFVGPNVMSNISVTFGGVERSRWAP